MSKFITAKGISAEIETIIKKAKKELILISYNYKINQSYFERLKTAVVDRNVKLQVVYGVDIKDETWDMLESIPNTEVRFLEKMHAKIYLNEERCIVGSMNFSEYSENNRNWEAAICIKKEYDPELYQDVYEECKEILKAAEVEVELDSVSMSEYHESANGNGVSNAGSNRGYDDEKWLTTGHCIRCNVEIDYDVDKPYCYNCYKVWDQFGDEYYEESSCHSCGKKWNTSMAKPECKKCYKSNY